VPREKVIEVMKSANSLVFPSLAYENFPMTIAEAFSVGLPVIASNRGAAGEIVENGVNGLVFEPGSATELADKIREAWRSTALIQSMGGCARASYERKYSGECTYRELSKIYENVVVQPRDAECRPQSCLN
jgi:glycosyltransferase involved in cell wall biosynthesis